MSSTSNKHHQRSTGSGNEGGGSDREGYFAPMSSSFAPAPMPSRATLSLRTQPPEKLQLRGYIYGLLSVFLLLVLGGLNQAATLGLALMIPGVALCVFPPKQRLGKWMDIGVVGFVICALFAFLPQFYWPTPEWRVEAVNKLGIDLPSVLSVQPRVSFESFGVLLAGVAWLYLVSSWSLNNTGRKWLLAIFSGFFVIYAGFIGYADAMLPGLYFDVAGATELGRSECLLVIASVLSCAFFVEGLGSRKLVYLVGFIATALSLYALVALDSHFGVLLYFLGVLLWFLIRLPSKSIPRYFKIGVLLATSLLVCVLVWADSSLDVVTRFVAPPTPSEVQEQASLYRDMGHMIAEAPLFGHGGGAFSAVFPQYRQNSMSHVAVDQPGSEYLRLLAEFGIFGGVFACVFLFGFIQRCRGLGLGRGGANRIVAMTGCIAFLGLCAVSAAAHQPAILYSTVLLAGLAFPRQKKPRALFRPIVWRCLGAGLSLLGVAWLVSGVTSAPFHSSTIVSYSQQSALKFQKEGDADATMASFDRALAWRPMDSRLYFTRAESELALSGAIEIAATDFQRARFLEPMIGEVCIEEGVAWLPYDRAHALSAWQIGLGRELESKELTFQDLLQHAEGDAALMRGLIQLSKADTVYRTLIFGSLRGHDFTTELESELRVSSSLAQFNRFQRTSIVRDWIAYGNLESVKAFIEKNPYGMYDVWWLRALVFEQEIAYESAAAVVREALIQPEIVGASLSGDRLVRTAREFAVNSDDVRKGTILLKSYIHEEDYISALKIADAMIDQGDAPIDVHYWRGEAFFQLGDMIESWYAYREYVEVVYGYGESVSP